MRYYGGKGKLVDFILETARQEVGDTFILGDAFSGTGIVGLEARKLGHEVKANDILFFAHCLGTSNLCFESGKGFLEVGGLTAAIQKLNHLDGVTGQITEHYSPAGAQKRQYFSAENAMKIDAISEEISRWQSLKAINELEKEALVGLLMRGINRVSNVTGTYAAFLKNWDSRAYKGLFMSETELNTDGPIGQSSNKHVNEFLATTDVDVMYLDPPYNSRDYASNYSLLETIATYAPDRELSPQGVTGSISHPDKKSQFSSKRSVREAFQTMFESIKAPVSILSYNNEGLLPVGELMTMMSDFGRVDSLSKQHKRFRSINQDGSKVKTDEHLIVLRKA